MNINEYSDFRRLCEIFNYRLNYIDMLKEWGFSVPKHVKVGLTKENATWIIGKIKNLNAKNPKVEELITLCNEYLELISYDSEDFSNYL